MYRVLVNDSIAGEFASPITAELYAKDLRRHWGLDAYVVFE